MDHALFLRGLLIGFSIAAPVGPIGILCIRRTITQGRLSGLVSGLGAATADAMYGCVSGFGLTMVANFLIDQQHLFRLIGGIFLLYLGVRTAISIPANHTASLLGADHKGLWEAYLSTLFLTLTNPITILSFAAIFAGLGLVDNDRTPLDAGFLVFGVFCGSTAWWTLLSGGVSLFRLHLKPSILLWVNRISGLVIIGFGLATLISLVSA